MIQSELKITQLEKQVNLLQEQVRLLTDRIQYLDRERVRAKNEIHQVMNEVKAKR